MDEKIKNPVMYCLDLLNCLGDRRRYYVAEREVVEAIKRRVDKLLNGANEAVFPAHSGTRAVYNLGG